MFPINDDNPIQIRPYVTIGLIVTNVFMFLYQIGLPTQGLSRFYRLYAIIPRELSASFAGVAVNQSVPEWATLITSQFLHGGWMHLISNMLFLWIFGNNIEDRMGHFRFVGFYLTCGLLAGLSQWFFSQGSTIPSLGASGAIAGVMGAYILRFPHAKINTLVWLGIFATFIRIPAIFFLGIWFFTQALNSIASLGAPTNVGGIAYWAHAGGFIFGVVLGPLFGLFSEDSR